MLRQLVRFGSLAAAVALIYWGCSTDSTGPQEQVEDPKPTLAFAVAGDSQVGIVGQELPESLVVQVSDQYGLGMRRVSVLFHVTAGGGTVSEGAVITDDDGRVAVSWLLGTASGAPQRLVATVASAPSITATLTATAIADVPAIMSSDSGGGQTAYRGTKLPQDIVVSVRDRYGNGVPGLVVQFSVAPGSGTLDSTNVTTDAVGRARTGWTLGVTGPNTALAVVRGLPGSPVIFSAAAHNLHLESTSPDPLVWGQIGTINGTGFSSTPADNIVTLGDDTLDVTAASPTQLQVILPSGCIPAGHYDVEVAVGSYRSGPINFEVNPPAFVELAVGEQLIVQDPAQFCFQFNEADGSEQYLVGVQSTSETVTTLTPITVTGTISPGATPAAPTGASALASTTQLGDRIDASRLSRLARHRAAELAIMPLDRSSFGTLTAQRADARQPALAPAAVDGTVSVGDTIPINVLADGATTCNQFDAITTVVRRIGTKSIWLEDVDNPPGGYSANDFQSLAQKFDNVIYAADAAYFGAPTDHDANGRVVMVITKEANRRESFGFTNVCDLGPRSATNLASNEGEFFYGETPDPNGVFGIDFNVADALFFAPVIQAHELVHVIQLGNRLAAGGPFPAPWILEGQATLGEEIVGYFDEGRTSGSNLPATVMYNQDDPASIDWYGIVVIDLAHYFGWGFDGVSPTTTSSRVVGAPQECSFLALPPDNPGPCLGDRDIHGTAWSLLRWLSDQFGPTYPGGEPALQQDIISSSTASGFALLASLIGVPMDSLLAQWSATLYVDDRLGGTNPRLTMTSWNLFDIFNGAPVATRLLPDQVTFSDFTKSKRVRAASTYYALISGTNRPATAVQALGDAGQTLPAQMQMWVVRMQ